MTKNEDVGYKFYPDTPKSREQYKNLVLKSISTAELVAELATRHGVTKYPRWVTSEEVFGHRLTMSGDCTILVVRE